MTLETLVAAKPLDSARVRVGDDIVFLGMPHRIVAIRPYVSDTEVGLRKAWRIAFDAFGWSITLIPGDQLDVVRA